MNLNDYQKWTKKTAIYPVSDYPVLGLAEETGELVGKFAKYYRDGGQFPRDAVVKEAGDIMWMLARILDDNGIEFQECLDANILKLESRLERNKLSGSGDDR